MQLHLVEPSPKYSRDRSHGAGGNVSRGPRGDASAEALRDPSPEVLPDASHPAGPDRSTAGEHDGSPPGGCDASPAAQPDRSCRWCRGPIRPDARRDSIYCSKRCRQAGHRFGRVLQARAHAERSLRIGYADPPYIERAHLYRGHPDYRGEVDHRELLQELDDGFDGWGLSAAADSIRLLLRFCDELGIEDVSVAAWFRGARSGRSSKPRSAWEPVLYKRARSVVLEDAGEDALIKVARARLTDPDRVIGAKPPEFSAWLFELLDVRPGDDFVDLFPGSGAVGRAWAEVCALSRPGLSAPETRLLERF